MALPKTFTGGERLFAGDLNDNFEALDTRLITAEAEIDTNASNLNASNLTSGTIPAARLPSGSIVRLLSMNATAQVTINTTAWVDTGLSLAITPLSASNKIYATYTVGIEFDSGTGTEAIGAVRLLRDATQIRINREGERDNDSRNITAHTHSVFDSPETASAVTYKVQARLLSTSDGRDMYINISGDQSVLTLFEVVG